MSHVFSLDQENATAEHNERIPKHKNRSIECVTTVHVGENGHHENAKRTMLGMILLGWWTYDDTRTNSVDEPVEESPKTKL